MVRYAVDILPSNLQVTAGKREEAAKFIEDRLNSWAEKGWELDQIGQIVTVEPPGCGCLAPLLGMKASIMEHNVLVFRNSK